MPRTIVKKFIVPETVLLHGKLISVMLDGKHMPYGATEPRVENLCGSFKERVFPENMQPALVHTMTCFGDQPQLHHLEGNVTLCSGKACFMGARSFKGVEKLSKALCLSTPANVIYIGVFCMKLGKRVHVSDGGLLETNFNRFDGKIRVAGRLFEQCNTMRFEITNFKHKPFFMEERFRPFRNDWTITGKGTVILRMTWKKMEWSQECEDACLDLCSRMAGVLKICSS